MYKLDVINNNDMKEIKLTSKLEEQQKGKWINAKFPNI